MLDRARNNPKIKFLPNTVVEDVYDVGQKTVTAVKLRNVVTGKIWEQEVDGFFVAIGHIPNTEAFPGQIELDPDGYIVSKGGARPTSKAFSMPATCRTAPTGRPSPPPARAAWRPSKWRGSWKPKVTKISAVNTLPILTS